MFSFQTCISLFAFVFYCRSVSAQCILPNIPKDASKSFPDPMKLLSLSAGSYQLTVEVTDGSNKKTTYVREYNNGMRGRVDSVILESQKSLLYDLNAIKGELFIFEDGSTNCETKYVDSNTEPPYKELNAYEWRYDDLNGNRFYGPFAMLLNAFYNRTNMRYEKSTIIRNLLANSWIRCENEGKLTIRYYLLDESESQAVVGFDKMSIPLRITVESTTINQIYEFMNFQNIIRDLSVFEIPKLKGCTRLKEDVVKISPRPDEYSFHAEIVFTPFKGSDKFSYIGDLEVISTKSFYMFRTFRRSSEITDEKPVSVKKIQTVYDKKNNFVYEMKDESEECEITDDFFNPLIALPDGQNLSLYQDSMLEIDAASSEQFHFLGEEIERGRKVFVFEKKGGLSNEFISTHYFLADDEKDFEKFEERNVPLKIIYESKAVFGSFKGIVIFNIYRYSSHVRETPDVSACLQDDKSQWFQILFPNKEEEKPHRLLDLLPKIKTSFSKAIFATNIVTPLQTPVIRVDVDADFVYVTVKVLERASFKHDFDLREKTAFLNPDKIKLLNENDCLKACIEEDQCKAVSHCGANCGLSFTEFSNVTTKIDSNCKLYNRKSLPSEMTISQVYSKLKELVYISQFTLTVYDRNGVVHELTANDVKTGFDFGRQKPQDLTDISGNFEVTRSSSKLKDHDSKAIQMSYYDCQQACLNDARCGSVSYCMVKSTCLQSEYHGDDLKGDRALDDTQCIILERNFVGYFVMTEGLRKVRKAESSFEAANPNSCATKCFEEKSFQCRSFDFCYGRGSNQMNCLMHSTHISESKGNDVNIDECSHYSRNYIYDFQEYQKDMIFFGHKEEKEIFDVSLEDCAASCAMDVECQTFDYCRSAQAPKFKCTTTKTTTDWNSGLQYRKAPSCTIYNKKSNNDALVTNFVQRSQVKEEHYLAEKKKDVFRREITEDTGYSKSMTGGISFLMFLIGAAIGSGAIFTYGYYRANRKV